MRGRKSLCDYQTPGASDTAYHIAHSKSWLSGLPMPWQWLSLSLRNPKKHIGTRGFKKKHLFCIRHISVVDMN